MTECLFQTRGRRTRHIYNKDEGNKRRWVVLMVVKFPCRLTIEKDVG